MLRTGLSKPKHVRFDRLRASAIERGSKTKRLNQVALLGFELLLADFTPGISLFEDLHG